MCTSQGVRDQGWLGVGSSIIHAKPRSQHILGVALQEVKITIPGKEPKRSLERIQE